MTTGRRNRNCQVCGHSERYRIEMLLAGGASLRAMARKFGIDHRALHRHWANHVADERKAQLIAGPVKLTELAERAAEMDLSLLDYLGLIRNGLLSQFTAAMEASDRNGAAIVAGRLLQCLEMVARLTGEMQRVTGGVTNNVLVLNSPLMAELQAMLAARLRPHPEALRAVLEGLRELTANAALQGAAQATGPLMLESPPRVTA
jgi:transposase-like protein